jgi:hypothetical protein
MAYQHTEDGTLVLDRAAAEELSKLCWEADKALAQLAGWPGMSPTLQDRLELAAAALMPFPEE